MICNSFYHSAIHRWSLLPPFKTQASGLTNLHIQPSRNSMEILILIYMVCSITVQAQVSTTKSSILANRLATENIRQCWTVRTMRTFYTDGHQLSKWRDRAHGFLSSPRADGSHRCCRRGGRWTGRPVVLLLVLTERLLGHVLQVMEPSSSSLWMCLSRGKPALVHRPWSGRVLLNTAGRSASQVPLVHKAIL